MKEEYLAILNEKEPSLYKAVTQKGQYGVGNVKLKTIGEGWTKQNHTLLEIKEDEKNAGYNFYFYDNEGNVESSFFLDYCQISDLRIAASFLDKDTLKKYKLQK